MSNEPNLELMREIGLIPSGVVPKHPVELFVDYPDLIAGVHEYADKIIAEYKQRAEAAEAKLRELAMQEPVFILMQADAGRDDLNADERSIILDATDFAISDYLEDGYTKTPLYAKPFPAPKQE